MCLYLCEAELTHNTSSSGGEDEVLGLEDLSVTCSKTKPLL